MGVSVLTEYQISELKRYLDPMYTGSFLRTEIPDIFSFLASTIINLKQEIDVLKSKIDSK